MNMIRPPKERLARFREMLVLPQEPLEALAPYKDMCAAHAVEFSEYLYRYFLAIPQTRTVLLHQSASDRLKEYWRRWFEELFFTGPSDEFLARLWESGLIHVKVGIDQHYINLAYAMSREFIHKMLQTEVPNEVCIEIVGKVDALLDLCLLVATDAYVMSTAKCSREVIMGLAHQVRNPATIIGGYVQLIRKVLHPASEEWGFCDVILHEAHRLERMLFEMGQYTDMFQREPVIRKLDIQPLLEGTLLKAGDSLEFWDYDLQWNLNPEARWVMGDERDCVVLFEHLFLNALENMTGEPSENRILEVVSQTESAGRAYLEISITNTGPTPKVEEIVDLLQPFHSTKPMGTGFGLPIARLAAHRSLGNLSLKAGPKGLTSRVSLPAANA